MGMKAFAFVRGIGRFPERRLKRCVALCLIGQYGRVLGRGRAERACALGAARPARRSTARVSSSMSSSFAIFCDCVFNSIRRPALNASTTSCHLVAGSEWPLAAADLNGASPAPHRWRAPVRPMRGEMPGLYGDAGGGTTGDAT